MPFIKSFVDKKPPEVSGTGWDFSLDNRDEQSAFTFGGLSLTQQAPLDSSSTASTDGSLAAAAATLT